MARRCDVTTLGEMKRERHVARSSTLLVVIALGLWNFWYTSSTLDLNKMKLSVSASSSSQSVVPPLSDTKDDRDELSYPASTKSYFFQNLTLQPHHLANQNYTWSGNQWIIPSSYIPMFLNSGHLREIWSQVDTLWLGDSTTRRAYATLYHLLNSTSSSSIDKDELDDPAIIDIHKYAHKQGNRSTVNGDHSSSCHHFRQDAKSTYFRGGMHNLWDSFAVCRTIPAVAAAEEAPRFDYARINCFKELPRVVSLTHELRRYSLIIVGIGIHDALHMPACEIPLPKAQQQIQGLMGGLKSGDSNGSMSPEKLKRLETTLKRVHAMNGGKVRMDVEEAFAQKAWDKGIKALTVALEEANNSTFRRTGVLWRTIGFSGASSTDKNSTSTKIIMNLNQQAQTNVVAAERMNKGYLGLVDWGTAIYPRSFPPYRIQGDIAAHYGVEARLLMAQMATQQVLRFLEFTRSDEPRYH